MILVHRYISLNTEMLTCNAVEYHLSQVHFCNICCSAMDTTILHCMCSGVDNTMQQVKALEFGCPEKQSHDSCLRRQTKPHIVKAHPFCSAVGLTPEIAIVPSPSVMPLI